MRMSFRNAVFAYSGATFALMLAGGIAWATARLAFAPQVVLDPDTLCLVEEPPAGYLAIVLDATDAWTEEQTEALRTNIRKIAQGLRSTEKLEVFEIPELLPNFPRPVFSMCSPGNDADANPWNQNPRMMQEVFEEKFMVPLNGYVDTLTALHEASTTPLIEVLSEITARDDYRMAGGRRILYLASDMLQNYGGYSQYRNRAYDYDQFAMSEYARKLTIDFRDAEVRILYLLNPKAESLQSRQHIEFYRHFFSATGGTLVSVEPL